MQVLWVNEAQAGDECPGVHALSLGFMDKAARDPKNCQLICNSRDGGVGSLSGWPMGIGRAVQNSHQRGCTVTQYRVSRWIRTGRCRSSEARMRSVGSPPSSGHVPVMRSPETSGAQRKRPVR